MDELLDQLQQDYEDVKTFMRVYPKALPRAGIVAKQIVPLFNTIEKIIATRAYSMNDSYEKESSKQTPQRVRRKAT